MSSRKAKRASKSFYSELSALGDWGEWQEVPKSRWHESPTPPIRGLTKFVYNKIYSVQFVDRTTDWGITTRLLIRRNDETAKVSWKDKQRIKNELVGENATAVEVFPPKSDLFDDANIYHLWIIPDGVHLPIVLDSDGRVKKDCVADPMF